MPAGLFYASVLGFGARVLAGEGLWSGLTASLLAVLIGPRLLWIVLYRLACTQRPSRIWAALYATALSLPAVLALLVALGLATAV